MTVTVLCPHCGVGCAIPADRLDAEGTCPVCGGLFLPRTAPREPPPLPPPPVILPVPRRRGPSTRPVTRPGPSIDRPPYTAPEPDDPLRPARSVGAVLFAMWIFCGLMGLVAPGTTAAILFWHVETARAVVLVGSVVAVPVGLFGAGCAMRGRGYGWAWVSVLLLTASYLVCCLTWVVTVWATAVLCRPDVRAAFAAADKSGGSS